MNYQFEDRNLFRALCGVADAGVADLEKLLEVRLIPRGHAFLIQSDSSERAGFAVEFFQAISDQYRKNGAHPPEYFDTRYLFERMKRRHDLKLADSAEAPIETIYTAYNGRPIQTRTHRQFEYVQSILHNAVTLCLGPAGTGKTFLSIAAACRQMQIGEQERLIITRPAVEAGESLGFLPGDLAQKVEPYLRPLYDALYECLGYEKVNDLLTARKIEIAPLAYMRGRTLNDSIILLDEGQNCTLPQLKMFLTRLGRNSKMVLSGDVTQIDLPAGRSGLSRCVRLLRNIEGIGVVEFQNEDIIRHPLVEKIVRAFELLNDESGG